MKHHLIFLVLLGLIFIIACSPDPHADVATLFPSPRIDLETIIAPGRSTPEAAIATVHATLESLATSSTTTVCAFHVSGCIGTECIYDYPNPCVGEGCFLYYEIIEGTMTDETCDALIERMQAGFEAIPDPDTGNIGYATRVESYPTSPIICTKAYPGHSTLTIIDTKFSEVSAQLCGQMP